MMHTHEPEQAAGTRTKALRSLAHHAGVPFAEVATASENGDLLAIVRKAMSPERKIARARQQLEARRHPNLTP